MKRSDLKVGESYYYDPSTTWAEGRWSGGRRVVVVDDKRYRLNRDPWRYRSSAYSEDPKGTAVLVDLYYDGLAEPAHVALPAVHLRGPWEQTRAAVEARREAVEAATAREAAAYDQAHLRVMDAVQRAIRAGFVVSVRPGDCTSVEVEIDVFEKMLERLADTTGEDRDGA